MMRFKKGDLFGPLVWAVLALLVTGLACQLTSPRPASWAGTPTAQARAEMSTAQALTEQADGGVEILMTPTETPIVAPESTVTLQPTPDREGPWLVYPAPDGDGLHAYDLSKKEVLFIPLPEPVYFDDLVGGRSPDGRTLMIRAGSPLVTDELALYQIELPAAQAPRITPLLSLPLQRQIVNQEGRLAQESFRAVTHPGGLAWSPDGRFLAFSAALDSQTSDLYVLDTLNERINRVNGLFSHNVTPHWSPDGTWLVSQELSEYDEELGWRADIVTALRAPIFDQQKTLFLASSESQYEVFVGWVNAQNFVSYEETAEGPKNLRRFNIESNNEAILFPFSFDHAAVDKDTRSIALTLSYEKAAPQGIDGGLYLLTEDRVDFRLHRAGEWKRLSSESGGMFVAVSSAGVLGFSPGKEGIFLPERDGLSTSPNGDWMIGWNQEGAWLYQPANAQPLQRVMDEGVERVFWQPDSEGFFIQSQEALFYLHFPRLLANPIDAVLFESMVFAWVE